VDELSDMAPTPHFLGDALPEKQSLFGIGITPCSYESATGAIMAAARERRSFAVAALATHGLMEAVHDPEFAQVVNNIDLVTPDGQPIRWAMNRLLDAELDERVYGPTLAEWVCAASEKDGIGVYLFGSTQRTCDLLEQSLIEQFPDLKVVGVQPDRFREATPAEDAEDVERIKASGAGVVLVGRGCPRQERWVEAHRGVIPASMLGVGAAFDYIAGTLATPPAWMQDLGLEWLHRLRHEPRRLWRRYLAANTTFLLRYAREDLKTRRARKRSGHASTGALVRGDE